MNIEIIGTESFGVRGMCCFVETKSRKILIDPGIALGYTRYGLLPHPYQVAVDEEIQKKIIKKWSEATDIVISHFHGDHVPLADANPYQLDLKKLIGINPGVRIWSKALSHLSLTERKRAESFSSILNKDLIEAEGKKDRILVFSKQVPHGDKDNAVTVMMTKIEEDHVFVHASDIQLLNSESVLKIIEWKPGIVFVGGPPLYLSGRISKKQIDKARSNAIKLSQNIDVLIIDHHLMRSTEGEIWLEHLNSNTEKKIICGADFMEKPRKLLEARRRSLYEDMPVAENWHEMYSEGRAKTDYYLKLAREIYK